MTADEFKLTMHEHDWKVTTKLRNMRVTSLEQSEIDRAFKDVVLPVWCKKATQKMIDRGLTFDILQDLYPADYFQDDIMDTEQFVHTLTEDEWGVIEQLYQMQVKDLLGGELTRAFADIDDVNEWRRYHKVVRQLMRRGLTFEMLSELYPRLKE